jgi:hypothetical protein
MCVNKSTFLAQGYAKKGSSIIARHNNKPGINQGCQFILSMDAHHVWPWAANWCHPHNEKVNNCGKEGPNKMMLLWKNLDPLIIGQSKAKEWDGEGWNGKGMWQIFDGMMVTCHDNHFSGEEMMAYAIKNMWGMIGTLHHDHFLKRVPTTYFLKE